MRQARQSVPLPTEKSLLYLKTNLWFGVKAGGSIGHIAGVVNGFLQAGYKVDFASAEAPVMVSPEAKFLAVRPPASFGLPYELNYYRFHRMFVQQVLAEGNSQNYAFIYQRMSVANYSGVVLARAWGIPLVIEYNGSEAWIAKNWGRPLRFHDLAVRAEDAVLKHADLVVTISDVLRDELIERGVPAERIVNYPNCIDAEVFDPSAYSIEQVCALRQGYGIDGQAALITFIGTFGQWHGIEVLAKAIRQLVDEDESWLQEEKVHFMLVGDGLKMSEVKKILGDGSSKIYCTLTGLVTQDRAPLHLAASNILMSPHVANEDGSRFFGSPTKLFEYMGMGKAIVASDLDQIGDVFLGSWHMKKDGPPVGSDKLQKSSALLTTPGDVEEIKEAIRYLVTHAEHRQILGDNARRLALQKYTWEKHCAAILQGLHNLQPGRSPIH
ncbi:MAG: glycosyltransferase [Desulfobulbaceae bacterium]|nr:glycosyltransferase [Desulfobulbaceae bacterium]